MRKDYSLFQEQGELCKGYGFDFIDEIENARFSEGKPEFRHEHWSFTRYSPERVAHLFHNWKKCFDTHEIHPGVKQAYEQELSLLEVCTGNYDEPDYIPITADLDIEALKREWHQGHCLYHHIFIGKESERAYADRRASIPGPMGRPADE